MSQQPLRQQERGRVMGQLAPSVRGRRIHVCAACDVPIAVYGRCAPCLHAYCLACAAGMSECLICRARITKLERIPAEAGLYISPLTLQAYRTEADLAKETRKLDAQLRRILATAAGAGNAAAMTGMLPQVASQNWKPPPPPGPPPPGHGAPAYGRSAAAAAAARAQAGSGRQYQAAAQPRPRHGPGTVMVPR